MVETYIWIAIGSVILFAFSSIITKYIIERVGGPINVILYQQFFSTIFLSILFLIRVQNGLNLYFLRDNNTLLLIFGASFFGFIGFVTLTIGFEVGNVSVGGVILSSRVFISIPLAFIFMNERYTLITYLLIFVAFIGAIINSWKEGMEFIELITFKAKGIRWFLTTAILWSIANLFIRSLSGEVPPDILIAVRQFVMFPMVVITYLIATRKYSWTRIIINKKNSIIFMNYSVLIILAQVMFINALGKSLTISEGIGVLEGTFTVLFSLLVAHFYNNDILKESMDRNSLIIRLLGASIALLGTIGVILTL